MDLSKIVVGERPPQVPPSPDPALSSLFFAGLTKAQEDPSVKVAEGGGAMLIAAGPTCQQRFDEWERRLPYFFRDYERNQNSIQDSFSTLRAPNASRETRLDALNNALGKSASMRAGLEEQVRVIDDLLLDCSDELTERQKLLLSDIKGKLSKDHERLNGMEFALKAIGVQMQVGDAAVSIGNTLGEMMNQIGRVLEELGSWIPPIPLPLPERAY